MSDRELLSLFRKVSKDLDARQRAQIRRLRGIERTLFEAVVERLVDQLVTKDGKISSRMGEVKISQAIDKVFDALDRGVISDFAKASVSDFKAIIAGTSLYYKALYQSTSRGNKFDEIKAKVNATMRKRIGLDDQGKSVEGGMLDRIGLSASARERVKQVAYAGVRSGKPMSALVKELSLTIKGTRARVGIAEEELSAFVLDTYQQFDRATNDQFAKRLNLTSFVYEGGLIETSREFCEKHNGKVFSVEEAERDFPKDPTLPRTTKERETGVLIDYDPTVDLGRWNCRHRTRYVSDQMAARLRKN